MKILTELNHNIKSINNKFNLNAYNKSTNLNFINIKDAMNHWNKIGKKKGYIFSNKGEHTLIKIILPTYNEASLLRMWLDYYEKLIGLHNIIIFDNESDNTEVLKILSDYRSRLLIIYTTKYYFDLEYNKDPAFEKIIDIIKNECKFVTKLDTDEFLCYYDRKNKKFDNSKLLDLLFNCETNIGTIWLSNIYTKEIFNDCKKYHNYTKFENLDLEKVFNDREHFFNNNGKSIFLSNQTFTLDWGNHNRNKNLMFNNLICLHLYLGDIDNRYKNNIATIYKEIRQKNININDFNINDNINIKNVLKKISNNENIFTGSHHKAKFNYEYLENPTEFKKKFINNTKNFILTTIIKDTIEK